MSSLDDETLDELLAIQMLVGWAGEGLSEPSRLGWWDTDIVDECGGGDFLQRLLPKTHQWAALEAAREAGRRKDAMLWKDNPAADKLRSLFHLGHDIDRQLEERLHEHKMSEADPYDTLPFVERINDGFDEGNFATWLQEGLEVDFKTVPGGRRLVGEPPAEPTAVARQLAAGLVPFADDYPTPHYQRR